MTAPTADTIVTRLEQNLEIPVNLQDAIVTVGRANRERRAAAVEIKKLQNMCAELEKRLVHAAGLSVHE